MGVAVREVLCNIAMLINVHMYMLIYLELSSRNTNTYDGGIGSALAQNTHRDSVTDRHTTI